MSAQWEAIAKRAIITLDVRPGDVVEVRDHAGRFDVLQELALAIEERGATPRIELLSSEFIQRLLTTTDPEHLERWDRNRAGWMQNTDRVIALEGHEPDLDVDQATLDAWRRATERLVQIEEGRKLPILILAVPTSPRASRNGVTLAAMENHVLPALEIAPAELKREIEKARNALNGAETLTVRTGEHQLHLDISGRTWLQDAGEFPDQERSGGVQPVLNLPAGSVYTTVNEGAASGTLALPQAGDATEVLLEFTNGRVSNISAASGAESLSNMFDQHTGEPRRISHIGIGLNPRLRASIEWPLVDEHRHGALFIAFGENRYLGGENESSLNVDFVIPSGTLLADGRTVVERGSLLV
jgi:leucyl aminopeptidase (aminopeptidase T)